MCLPASVLEHIEPSECVFKLSSSVKTSRGVGKIAMTQRRLFLLTDGRPGYVEVAQYRDLEVRLKIWEHFKRKRSQSGIESLLWLCPVMIHPFLLYRRWRCRRLPSCSCESQVWSCEFMAERKLSKLIWRLRPIYGIWWSKRCGPAAAWLTSTRWYSCNQSDAVRMWAHSIHSREYKNMHYYSLTYALARFI